MVKSKKKTLISFKLSNKSILKNYYLKNKIITPVYPNGIMTNFEDLPEVYMANGAIEVIGSKVLSKLKNRFGNKVGYYFMPNICAYDIDDYVDFRISEYLFKNFFYSIFKNNKLNDKK